VLSPTARATRAERVGPAHWTESQRTQLCGQVCGVSRQASTCPGMRDIDVSDIRPVAARRMRRAKRLMVRSRARVTCCRNSVSKSSQTVSVEADTRALCAASWTDSPEPSAEAATFLTKCARLACWPPHRWQDASSGTLFTPPRVGNGRFALGRAGPRGHPTVPSTAAIARHALDHLHRARPTGMPVLAASTTLKSQSRAHKDGVHATARALSRCPVAGSNR